MEDPERGGKEAAVLEFHQERNREMNQHQYEASTRTEDRYGVDNLNDEADLSSHDVSTSVEMVPLGKDTDTNSKIMRGIDQGHVIGKNDENHTYFDFRQHWFSFVALLSTKSILLLLLQGAVGTVPWGIVNTYLNDFLSEDRGMSVQVSSAATWMTRHLHTNFLNPIFVSSTSTQLQQYLFLVLGISLECCSEVEGVATCIMSIVAILPYWLGQWRY